MKRFLALILCVALLLTSCGATTPKNDAITETSVQTQQLIVEEDEPNFESLSDTDLPEYLNNAVYSELVDNLDPEQYFVESVDTIYISKEYLDEVAYNSEANIYFGYTLAELDETFVDKKYVFALSDEGETEVREFQEYKGDTYDQILKNVAIGAGVILVCVTVAIITKNPAASATAGKTVKMIYAASTMGAKAGTKMALQGAAIGGATSAVLESFKTGDFEEIRDAALLGASEGIKWGAIFGVAKGVSEGIRVVNNSKFFKPGTKQATKYPEGIEFTSGPNGEAYPRFEKYAKATAKFDTPTLEASTNHTGLSGNYWYDSKLANAQCGFKQTPQGYVWHHVEDMRTMILVPQDVHSVAFGGMPHKGGASLIEKYLESLVE